MTTWISGQTDSYLPAVDLSSSNGYGVMISTTGGDPAGSIRPCTDAKRLVGVVLYGAPAYNATATNTLLGLGQRVATVQKSGRVRAIASAAIAAGVNVTINTADGRFRTAVATEVVVGIARTAASGAGTSFELDLHAAAGVTA